MADDYTQQHNIHPQWIGYFAVLYLLLVILSQSESMRDVAIALAWLISISVLMLLINSGLVSKESIGRVGI